jgi:DNA mismatch endonuclease (patch repair protein)
MQAVRRQDTKPEIRVAAILDAAGLTYKRHPEELAGRPDFYFPDSKVALFVHGCFWHGHVACVKGRRRPGTRTEYWAARIARNQARDRRVARQLRAVGIGVFAVWECRLHKKSLPPRLLRRLSVLPSQT